MEPSRADEPIFFARAERSPMQRVIATAERIAPSDAHVLLLGEPGTGKEALARMVHARSGRTGAFVILRSGAAAEERHAFEELFGPEGAREDAVGGLFAAARGGTLLLEDVDRLPPSVQAALALRLRHAEAAPRVIATSSLNVHVEVLGRRFRRDLYDALACAVELPPLRARPGDAVAVFERLWAEAGREDPLPPEALEIVRHHPWPGNVRQLHAFATRLAVMTDGGAVTAAEVRAQLSRPGESTRARPDLAAQAHARGERRRATGPRDLPAVIDLPRFLDDLENALIDWALEVSADNRTAAGGLLGLQRTTLVEKLRRREGHGRHGTAGSRRAEPEPPEGAPCWS